MASNATQIAGVRETIATLRRLEPELARQAVKDIKGPAMPAAAAIRAVAPPVPLSGMGAYGPVKTSANYGGRRQGDEYPLVKIKMTAPGWTVASDMAANSTPGETMVDNLDRKYGNRASRWAWPTVERQMANIQLAIAKAVKEVERLANESLRG